MGPLALGCLNAPCGRHILPQLDGLFPKFVFWLSQDAEDVLQLPLQGITFEASHLEPKFMSL